MCAPPTAIARPPSMTTQEYYRHPAVRRRVREYCGSTHGCPATSVYVAALNPRAAHQPDTPRPTWEAAALYPPEELGRLFDEGADIARSMWDTESLLFFLDLDYLNADHPAEPFLHPADAFFALEPAYRAAHHVLHSFGIEALELATGRGYHFSGRIPWTHPVIHHLAELVSETPAWHATMAERLPAWVTQRLDAQQARASAGLGMLVEYLAHLILQRAAAQSPVPVVLNGTEVGTGLTGRACVSIDLSYVGDPLDARHLRVAFGAYQTHRLRPDLFGPAVATQVPLLAEVPRGHQSLYRLLTDTRLARGAVRSAEAQSSSELPDVAQGVATLLVDYLPSRLAAFHRDFYAVTAHPAEKWAETYDRLDPRSLASCVSWPLLQPNDFLLQPARIQMLVRGLLAEGWEPRHIAGLIHSHYARDYGWGTRWTRLDARTRAEFDVRVFAGMVATGVDRGIDFNCVSAKEKGVCPHDPECHRDLRLDRIRLIELVRA